MADNSIASKIGIPVVLPVITTDVAYTPTFTGFGTVTGVAFFYRQVGDKYHISGKFTTGTPTAVGASFSLPNSYTVSRTAIQGKWSRGNATATALKTGTFVAASGNSTILFSLDDKAAAFSPDAGANGTDFVGAGETIYIDGELVVNITQLAGSTSQAYGAGQATSVTPGLVMGGTVPGSTAGSTPAAGYIGERSKSQLLRASNTALTTTAAKTVVSNTIPSAGVWLMYGNVGFVGSATTTLLRAEFSTGANTLNLPPSGTGTGSDDSAFTSAASNVLNNGDCGGALAPIVVITTAATTFYIVATSTFATGTVGAYGRIEAVRIA